jgi:hypothetical protein
MVLPGYRASGVPRLGVMLLIAVLMNDTFRNLATSWSTKKK